MTEMHALRRRPLFTPLFIAILAAVVAVGALGWGVYGLWQPPGTVIVVRHAEKAVSANENPPLAPAGAARADALAAMFASAGVDAVFASDYVRSLETAAPLAKRLSLPVQVYDAGDTAALVDEIDDHHRTDTVFVVGHSNTVPAIVRALSGKDTGDLAEDRYGDVFIVVRPRWGRTTVTRIYQTAP